MLRCRLGKVEQWNSPGQTGQGGYGGRCLGLGGKQEQGAGAGPGSRDPRASPSPAAAEVVLARGPRLSLQSCVLMDKLVKVTRVQPTL